jgi:hypothetical protein
MLDKNRQMIGEAFAEALERYLGETLHDTIELENIDGTISVPTFLDQSYRFYKARIAGTQIVVMAAQGNVATPADIAKHVSLVCSAVDGIAVFAAPSLKAHNRSRLIALRVPFLVPGNQLYIPDLAMDLREYFRAPKPKSAEALSPAAQAVFFHHMLRLDQFTTTPSTIAEHLHYSPMSVGRAFDNLAATGLATTEKRGKARHIQFEADRRELMDAARPLLRSPVRSVKHIGTGHAAPNLKLSGETALAKLTDVAPPRMETLAVVASDWKATAETLELVQVDDFETRFMVETWSYDPGGLSDGPVVDPLSLYAQFHDHRDERISMAADRLLENVKW